MQSGSFVVLSLAPVDYSVIIPTFRRPRELAEALASVLCQEGATIEVIVVDDSPEGSGQEVVQGLDDARVSYLKNPNPTGGVPSVVRNLLAGLLQRGNLYIFLTMMILCPKAITFG